MFSQYWLNLIHDANRRGQAIVFPATRYIALFTVMPTRNTAGTELSTGAGYTGYARQAYAASMANWSGTQGAGTTSASSGTSTDVSNNVAVEFSASLAAAWPTVVGWGEFDALTVGNLLEFDPIVDSNGDPITRSFSIGDPVSFAPGTLIARGS
jgi:hypothetical protein